ncbi:MAG: hypothetical protein WBG73_17150 [Coleofasciculaceae cyanobacterium]
MVDQTLAGWWFVTIYSYVTRFVRQASKKMYKVTAKPDTTFLG